MDKEAIGKRLEVCKQAAEAGGKILLEKMGKVRAREKGPSDWVTEADWASQEAIVRVIREAFPEDAILGEEGLSSKQVAPAEGVRWLIDPLDGTTNYMHGILHFAVSVGVEEKGVVMAGVIFDPVHGDCYVASRGGGAWRNGRRLQTSQVQHLAEAVGAVGFPPRVQQHSPDLKVFLEALKYCQTLRRTGSTALNLGYLAAGQFDLFWSFSTQIWDVAAGLLLVEEAGGVVSNPYGGPLELHTGQFLAAANPTLHQQLQQLVLQAKLLP